MAFAPAAAPPLTLRAAAICGGCGLVLVAVSVWLWGLEAGDPAAVHRFVRTYLLDPARDPVLARIWWALSDLGHGSFVVALLGACVVVRGSPRLLQDAVVVVGSSAAVANLLKLVIARARPTAADLHSWPSGHATAALAVALCFAAHRRVLWFAVPLAVLVGCARVVRERHWPADVVGGFGIACLVAAVGARLPTWIPAERCRASHRVLLAGLLAAATLAELALSRYVHGTHGYLNLLVQPCVLVAALWAVRLATPASS